MVFDLCDSPGIRIQYEGLFEILDDMIENGNYDDSRWQKEFEPIVRLIRNEPVKDDLFFFKQFISLIRGELSNRLVFRIWNFHFLDPKTIDFISYLFRTETGKEIVIAGIYDESWSDDRIERFIKSHCKDEHVEIEKAES